MQTNQETPNALERRIDMSVTLADIDRDVDARIKKLSRTVKMSGFRPGKVPLKVVARTYESQVRSEAIGAAVEKVFGETVRAQKLRVAGYPRIEPKETTGSGVLEFSAVFEVYPEVVVGDLSERVIEKPVLEVGEAEIDRTIEVLRRQRTRFEAIERVAADGDRVVIDFVGRKNGEPFEGGQAIEFPFVLGSGTLLKDFETAVAGLKAGENKTFDLTFPAEYQATNLAGQTVQFEVTVRRVEAPVLPEIDADFARALGIGDGDIAKLREEVKGNLTREVKRRIQSDVKNQVMEALLAAAPIEAPRALVQAESAQLVENARRDLAARGIPVDRAPVESWFADQAVQRVKLGLIMAELVKTNDLHAKPEQVRVLVEEIAQSYEDPAELVRWYYAQPERLAQAEAVATEENVVAWVCAKARVSDKTVSFDDLMGSAGANAS
ncbi:MAG: trigger factor [Azoarcus sp.]|jgi:trigger factor|nr:trigger factor [Azoarcus sp.]